MLYRLLGVVVLFAVIVLGQTFGDPWAVEYQVKVVARRICTDVFNETRNGVPVEKRVAAAGIRAGAAEAGVNLREQNYSFIAEQVPGFGWVCHAKVAFARDTPWFLIGDVLSMKPLHTVHHITLEKEYPR